MCSRGSKEIIFGIPTLMIGIGIVFIIHGILLWIYSSKHPVKKREEELDTPKYVFKTSSFGYPLISYNNRIHDEYQTILKMDLRDETNPHEKAIENYKKFLSQHRPDLTPYGYSKVLIDLSLEEIFCKRYEEANQNLNIAEVTCKSSDLFAIKSLLILEWDQDLHEASMLFYDATFGFPKMTMSYKKLVSEYIKLRKDEKYKSKLTKNVSKYFCQRCARKLVSAKAVCKKCGFHKSKRAFYTQLAHQTLNFNN